MGLKNERGDLNKQDNRAGHFSRATDFPSPTRSAVSPLTCVFYACKRPVINSALRIGGALYCNFAANAVSALKIRPGRDLSPPPPLPYAAVIRIIGFSMVFSRVHACRKCESREMHPGDDVIVRLRSPPIRKIARGVEGGEGERKFSNR